MELNTLISIAEITPSNSCVIFSSELFIVMATRLASWIFFSSISLSTILKEVTKVANTNNKKGKITAIKKVMTIDFFKLFLFIVYSFKFSLFNYKRRGFSASIASIIYKKIFLNSIYDFIVYNSFFEIFTIFWLSYK